MHVHYLGHYQTRVVHMTSLTNTCTIDIDSRDVALSSDLTPIDAFSDIVQLVDIFCRLGMNIGCDYETCSELRAMLQREIVRMIRTIDKHSHLHFLLHLTLPHIRYIMQIGILDICIDLKSVTVYEFTNAVTLFIERSSDTPFPIQTSFD